MTRHDTYSAPRSSAICIRQSLSVPAKPLKSQKLSPGYFKSYTRTSEGALGTYMLIVVMNSYNKKERNNRYWRFVTTVFLYLADAAVL